jgi:hypothetical protein
MGELRVDNNRKEKVKRQRSKVAYLRRKSDQILCYQLRTKDHRLNLYVYLIDYFSMWVVKNVSHKFIIHANTIL